MFYLWIFMPYFTYKVNGFELYPNKNRNMGTWDEKLSLGIPNGGYFDYKCCIGNYEYVLGVISSK